MRAISVLRHSLRGMDVCSNLSNSSLPEGMVLWIRTVDYHTNGMPFRIVTETQPRAVFTAGATLLDKRRHFMTQGDIFRKITMREPRGHDGMYGGFLAEPDKADKGDVAIIFVDKNTYSTMCGHGTIATTRYAIDHGLVPKMEPETKVNVQVPCGVIEAFAEVRNQRATGRIRIKAPKGYLHAVDREIEFEGKRVAYDIGYGGAFYVIVKASDLGVNIWSDDLQKIGSVGLAFKNAAAAASPLLLNDPRAPNDFLFFYGVILADHRIPQTIGATLDHVIAFGDGGQVDRSPCGSGTTARVSVLVGRGLMSPGQAVGFGNPQTGPDSRFLVTVNSCGHKEVPMGTVSVSVENSTQCEIEGRAFMTGENKFVLEEGDIFPEGLELKRACEQI